MLLTVLVRTIYEKELLYFSLVSPLFIGFYVTPTQYRQYREVPALLVEKDPVHSVHNFRHERTPE
jgi:hypothetical protein